MNQTMNGLTLRATIVALVLILAAVTPGLSPLDGVAYAQDTPVAPVLSGRPLPDGSVVNLSWTETAGATSYNLWRDDGTGWGTAPLATGLTGTTYADSAVTAGKTYAYAVVPIPAATPPLWSNILEVTIPGGTPALQKPGVPEFTSVEPSGMTSVVLTWGAAPRAVSYEVIRWIPATTSWTADLTGGTTGLTYTDTGLTAGNTYYYLVRAVNAASTGATEEWSDYGTATLPTATVVPVLSLSHPARTRVELSWTPATGTNVEYDLQRRKDVVSGTPGSLTTAAGTFARLPDALLSATEFVDSKAVFDDDNDSTNTVPDTVYSIVYHYRVQAVVDGVQRGWSNVKMATVPSTSNLPGTPATLTAVSAGTDSITITWTAGSPDIATMYRFQWKSGNQDWHSSREATTSAMTRTHTGRSPGTAYTYRVRGENVNGNSDWSAEATATTDSAITAEGRLGTPMGLSVTDATTTATGGALEPKLKLTWSRVQGENIGYEVMRWSGTAWAAVTAATDGTAVFTTKMTSYTDSTGLSAGTSYDYVVRAVMTNAAGDTGLEWSEWTADEMGMTKANKPGQPTLVAEQRGDTSVWLSWTPAATSNTVGAATEYRLRFRRLPTSTWTSLQPGADMMTHVHMGLTPGRTYHYQVAAVNSAGMGTWSDEKAATTTMSQKPGTPTNVMVADNSVVATDGAITTTQLKITWNKVSGASGYEIMRWLTTTTPNAWGSLTGTAGEQTAVGDVMEHTDASTDLDAGMTYHYLVRAITATAKGDWAAYKSGTTKLAKPTAPTLVATSRGQTIVQLSWSAVTGATSYQLRFIGTRDKPANIRDTDYTSISLNPANVMHYTHMGRMAGTRYEYSVRAVLPNGVMTDWGADTAVTTRPPRPTGFMADASDHENVALTWNHVSFDGTGTGDAELTTAAGYEVQVRVSGGEWGTLTVTCAGTPVKCTAAHGTGDTPPAAGGTQFFYRLRAIGTAATPLTYSYWVYANETTPAAPGN